MKIYYVTLRDGKAGSMSLAKILAMHPGYKVTECDIEDFTGHLYSSEYK